MSSDWINKAKEAAKQAAEEAKKLAETAKNANYGEMFDKTKNMATHAAEEAKKAANNVMHKDTPTTEEIIPTQDNPQGMTGGMSDQLKRTVLAKLEQADGLIHEIKNLLK